VAIELVAGGERRGGWRIPPDAAWHWLEAERFAWPADGELRIALPADPAHGRRGAVVVDKLELDWR
jgi:hypothetical protein